MSKNANSSAELLSSMESRPLAVAFPQALQHVLAMLVGNITPPMLIANLLEMTPGTADHADTGSDDYRRNHNITSALSDSWLWYGTSQCYGRGLCLYADPDDDRNPIRDCGNFWFAACGGLCLDFYRDVSRKNTALFPADCQRHGCFKYRPVTV